MPPRKSTASRKSDTTTTARLVPMDDAVPKDSIPTPAPPTPVPVPVPAVLPAPVTVPVMAPASTPPQPEKKDKDKDKDKEKGKENEKGKEKEKEKSKEHNEPVTIEVTYLPSLLQRKHDKTDSPNLQDLTLPKSIITRLAKGVLPPNTQIQANAILALSNSTTVFISHLAAHANTITAEAGKKTVTPADVFKALNDTEFQFLREPLEAEFAKFNAIQAEKRTSAKSKKVQPKKPDGTDTAMADTSLADADADTTIASEASGPRAKRARVDPNAAPEVEDDAETEDEEPVPEDDDEQDEVDEEEDDEAEGEPSGDDTQDALEERQGREDADEALDGDESD
ncbi:histone-fold-containing protein [Thelonectria olida]|uniref:DNA polymerase epsilon subunit D n=1 Tax=Thelonectria olida TaxID=1576542 RepID=A0A9P9AVJ1_9HYPO|nr:histone-fold-containing protein [Thelonectria olida]